MVALMSDVSEASSALLDGYLSEDEAAAQRRKSKRTLRYERQRGAGPPFIKDGKQVLYSVASFRAWLKGMERQPVRGPGVKV
jgi:hypothetical protein